MGIDIYAKWDGMTNEDGQAQITGFSTDHGYVGYLREAYHGEPYATKVLLPETWETGEATIPAAVLRERLPAVLTAAAERERTLYNGGEDAVGRIAKSYEDFVALIERLEAEGRNPRIVNSY